MAAVSLKPSSRGVVALIIVAVLLFFGCALAYVAAAGKMKGAAKELAKKEKQVAASKEIAQKLEKSKLEYFDAQSQLRCLESSVSTQAYVPTLLKQLEHLGKSVDLKVVGVRPQPSDEQQKSRKISSGSDASQGNVEKASEEKSTADGKVVEERPAPYDELKIDVQVEGKYMNALNFLYKLTSFPKIIAVNKVEMAPTGVVCTGLTPRLSIKVNVTAFVLSEDVPVARPGDTGDTTSASKGGTDNEAG